MTPVLLGLGSNIRRYHHLQLALDALAEQFPELQLSAVYEADAVGFSGPAFLNMVVSFDCGLPVAELAVWLRRLEYKHGRPAAAVKYSSRSLDIDILCYGALCGEVEIAPDLAAELSLGKLVLPRGEIDENAYVLKPLAELAAGHCHPVSGRPFAWHWQQFRQEAGQDLRRVDFRWRGRWVSRAEPSAVLAAGQ